MSEEKKRGRGKPKRYEGEESERLSVLVRPRYKYIIEGIAKARQTTISEAMEYAIAYSSRNFYLDDKSLYEWSLPIDPLMEIINRYFDAILDSEDQYQDNSESHRKVISDFYSKPDIFKKPIDIYINEVMSKHQSLCLEDIGFIELSKVFNTEKLLIALVEEWRSAATPIQVAKILYLYSFLYSNEIIRCKMDIQHPEWMRMTIIQVAAILCEGTWTIDKFTNSISGESLKKVIEDPRIKSSFISQSVSFIDKEIHKIEDDE